MHSIKFLMPFHYWRTFVKEKMQIKWLLKNLKLQVDQILGLIHRQFCENVVLVNAKVFVGRSSAFYDPTAYNTNPSQQEGTHHRG